MSESARTALIGDATELLRLGPNVSVPAALLARLLDELLLLSHAWPEENASDRENWDWARPPATATESLDILSLAMQASRSDRAYIELHRGQLRCLCEAIVQIDRPFATGIFAPIPPAHATDVVLPAAPGGGGPGMPRALPTASVRRGANAGSTVGSSSAPQSRGKRKAMFGIKVNRPSASLPPPFVPPVPKKTQPAKWQRAKTPRAVSSPTLNPQSPTRRPAPRLRSGWSQRYDLRRAKLEAAAESDRRIRRFAARAILAVAAVVATLTRW